MLRKFAEIRNHLPELRVVRAAASNLQARAETIDGEETIVFTGHAAVFDAPSDELGGRHYRFIEYVKRGAFRKALEEKQDTVYLYDHVGMPYARTTADNLLLTEDQRGLDVEAHSPRTSQAQDLALSMRAKNVRHMSFAFTCLEDEWTEHNDGDVTIVRRDVIKIDRLFDVSAVTFPAYPQTDAAVRQLEQRRAAERFGFEFSPMPADQFEELLREQSALTEGSATSVRRGPEPEQLEIAKRHLELAELPITIP